MREPPEGARGGWSRERPPLAETQASRAGVVSIVARAPAVDKARAARRRGKIAGPTTEGALMITAVEFIQGGLTQLHTNLDKQLDGITPEQLHAIPGGTGTANTIAWGIWHYVRTEDNVVRYILQNKKPPQWIEGGYAERLGLPANA